MHVLHVVPERSQGISIRDGNERIKTGSTFYTRVKIHPHPTIISLVDGRSQNQDIYLLTLLYTNGGVVEALKGVRGGKNRHQGASGRKGGRGPDWGMGDLER